MAAKISASATSTYRIEEAVYETAQQRIEALAAQQQHAQEVDPQQDEIPIMRRKDEKGHLIPDAIVCAMTAGECEVASESCRAVIQAVITHVRTAHVPDNGLPSQ